MEKFSIHQCFTLLWDFIGSSLYSKVSMKKIFPYQRLRNEGKPTDDLIIRSSHTSDPFRDSDVSIGHFQGIFIKQLQSFLWFLPVGLLWSHLTAFVWNKQSTISMRLLLQSRFCFNFSPALNNHFTWKSPGAPSYSFR